MRKVGACHKFPILDISLLLDLERMHKGILLYSRADDKMDELARSTGIYRGAMNCHRRRQRRKL